MEKDSGSFRDPSGYIYKLKDNKIIREIREPGHSDYDSLMESGLYDELVSNSLLVAHKDVTEKHRKDFKKAYKVIQPDVIKFISYPYEWAFSQYKDAALTTLEIHRRALGKGLTLKDASAYNIQFQDGHPVFIDTLSFEKYEDGEPWVAYKQFCQHFLAPLALMSRTDIELNKLMQTYIDGIPLALACKLLPKRAKLQPGLYAHLYMHSRSQSKHENTKSETVEKVRKARLSKNSHIGLIESLAHTVKSMQLPKSSTEWGEYYTFTNYSPSAFKSKEKLVFDMIKKVKPEFVWDLGANDGSFSRVAAAAGPKINVASFDIDPNAVEKNYRTVSKNNEKQILPLLLDLTNPSSAIGWANSERLSLIERGPADLVMSLALIHHLAISNNVPLDELAFFMARISKYLVIEFVPKGDSQVNILLATRKDIFPDYNEKGFEKAFSARFKIIDKKKVPGTKRTLYLLKTK